MEKAMEDEVVRQDCEKTKEQIDKDKENSNMRKE